MFRILAAFLLLSFPAFAQEGYQIQNGVNTSPVPSAIAPNTPLSAGVVTATGGSTSAALSNIVPLNIFNFGAVCNGSTDDSAAINAAVATGLRITIPTNDVCNGASVVQNTITGSFSGPGQIKTSDGNLRAPIVNQIVTRPATGTPGVTTAFNGNLSQVPIAIEQRIGGSTTLGQPSSSYLFTNETSAMFAYGYNSSGYVSSTNGTGGRTGAGIIDLQIGQYGQGDYGAIWCDGVIASTLSGASTFFASPGLQCMEGQLTGGANGAYIEYLGDMDINDGGFDIAGYGTVMNYDRTVAAEAIGVEWVGDWRHSSGTAPIDAFAADVGSAMEGISFSEASFASNYKAAILALTSGGTGYVVGDLLTVTGGTSKTPTVIKVATVSSGVIQTYTIANAGIYSVPPLTAGSYGALTVTGGTGTGAAIAGSYSAGNVFVFPGAGGCMSPASVIGSPNTELGGYWGSLCISPGWLNWGAGNTAASTAGFNNVTIGWNDQLHGTNNVLLGQYANDNASVGALYWSNGTPSGYGAAQTSWRNIFGSGVATSGGPVTVRLTTNGGAASGTNSYPVIVSSAGNISFRVVIIDENNSDAASWIWRNGLLTRTSSGNATYTGDASTATSPDHYVGAGSTATITASADTVNQTFSLIVTLPTGNTHTWHCEAKLDVDQVQ